MAHEDMLTLKAIIKYCDQAQEAIEELNLTKDNFYYSNTGKNAVSMCVQTIGEYVKDLSEEFKLENSHIKWVSIVGMRNRFAHGYDGMDEDIIWDTASFKVSPGLAVLKLQLYF